MESVSVGVVASEIITAHHCSVLNGDQGWVLGSTNLATW